MSHLPILGELFISHRIEFLLIGLVLALIIGMNNSEKALYWIAASSTVYIMVTSV